jgi:copper chaperone CopZ
VQIKEKLMVLHSLVLLILLTASVPGCTAQNDVQDKQAGISEVSEGIRIVEIALPGMFCPACANNAETAFIGMDGVIEAEVDIKTKKGRVVYESVVTSAEQLVLNPVIQSYDGKVLSDRDYR